MKVILSEILYLIKIQVMRLITGLFLLMMCLGCNEKKHPKIEIYLLKHPVESYEGILFRETERYKDLDSTDMDWYKNLRVDTITNQPIYGGRFEVTTDDLSDYPFIINDEILCFDSSKDIFVFDTVVRKRIEYLFPGKHNVQFAITVDKTPVLTGYFWTGMWSRLPNTYNFYTDAGNIYKIKERDTTEISYKLEFANPEFLKQIHKKRPSYNAILIEALKGSERLKT